MEPDPDEEPDLPLGDAPLDDPDSKSGSEGGVLSPEDLEPDEDYAVEIDDGRYVVSPTGKPDAEPAGEEGGGRRSGADPERGSGTEETSSHAEVPEGTYSYSLTLSVENKKLETSAGHDDVSACFEEFVAEYVNLVSDDTPSDEVLGVLIASSIDVSLPPAAFEAAVRGLGVSPDDSVDDLLEAARESGGFSLNP